MSKEPLGSIVLRLLADDVSPAELRKVLRHLRDRPKLRERCSTISMMVEADDIQKSNCCSHMVTVLLSWIKPNDQEDYDEANSKRFTRMGNEDLWVDHLGSISKDNLWHNHMMRVDLKPVVNRQDQCYITVELYEILEAIENLWAHQRRYTVLSRPKDALEFMDDQLTARNSILKA